MKGSYLGPSFNDYEVEAELIECGARYKKISDEQIFEKVISLLLMKKQLAGCRVEWNLVRAL